MTRRAGAHRTWPDGLVPAVVQDVADGRVLMVAYMDAEALAATLETGEVHFHSRSRDRLWRKGETSGNVLRLVDLATDCDGDALLVTVDPVGPTCHRDTRSCFDPDGAPAERDHAGVRLARDALGDDRAARRRAPEGSYTASLLDGGVDAAGRKVTEEATEVLLAAKDDAAASTSATRDALRGRGGRPAVPRARPARGTGPAAGCRSRCDGPARRATLEVALQRDRTPLSDDTRRGRLEHASRSPVDAASASTGPDYRSIPLSDANRMRSIGQRDPR